MHADKHQSFLQVDFNTLVIKVSYKVILSLLMCMIKYSQSTQSNKFAISLQYLRKEVWDRFHFLLADEHHKLALSVLMEVTRHVQSTQNMNLVIFFQYLKEKNINESYFLHADKHESFLQVDTNILSMFGQTKFCTCNKKF